MRTFLFMILALGSAAGGFALYLRLQQPPAPLAAGQISPSPQAIDRHAPVIGDIGGGSRPWRT